ncbi:MAG: lytic murein transglycosylase [Rhizomicrobium sp.]|nr:lytic murein transglycosylase [Rhizomicrobium sp.]
MRGIVLFLAYLLSLLLIAVAYGAQGATPPIPTPSPLAEDAAFAAFLKDFRAEALNAGIKAETYDAATSGIVRNQRVADHNLNQPEFVKPIWEYLDSAVSPRRVADGRTVMIANTEILAQVSAKYGTPGEILVSIWGNESDYGRGGGGYKMIEALATLAYSGPRSDYARPQLIAALKMIEREHYDPASMTSSWAGAFGQTQFVPTTFLAQAVDGDGDGKIDLWHDVPDALASTANVLAMAGWAKDKPWGYEVALPSGFAYDDADLDLTKSVATWKKAGVKTAAGNELPASGDPASIFLPAGAQGPAFLVFANFKTILRYNNAASYALAVCLLGDQLKGASPVLAAWPRSLKPLSRDERLALQDSLVQLGFDIGKVDGLIGAKSRAAVRAWQKAHAVPADGYATLEIASRIALDARVKLAVP